MKGVCLLINVRPYMLSQLTERLNKIDIRCFHISSSAEKLSVRFNVSRHGHLSDVYINDIPIDISDVLGSYAEMYAPNATANQIDFETFRTAEQSSALALLRYALPRSLNSPRYGSLLGGPLTPPQQWAMVSRHFPELLSHADLLKLLRRYVEQPVGSVWPMERLGALCSCQFIGRKQYHFVWENFCPRQLTADGSHFTKFKHQIDELREIFEFDVGEVIYQFDGQFRFVSIRPFFGLKFPFDRYPMALDDLALSCYSQ